MATESPVRMLSSSGIRSGIGPMADGLRGASVAGHGSSPTRDGVAQELGLLFKGQNRSRYENVFSSGGREVRDVPQRSGSAPPSVEGSLAAMGGLFSNAPLSPRSAGRVAKQASENTGSEDEQLLRSDPAYMAYYYSHVNLNPRLPAPITSTTREHWRLAQQLNSNSRQLLGGIGDKRKLRSGDDNNSKSLFSTQPVLPTHREEPEPLDDENSTLEAMGRRSSSEWMDRGDAVLGHSALGMGPRPKSLVDLIQEDFPRTPSPVYNHSRSSSRAANDDGDASNVLDSQLTHIRESSITPAELQAAALGSRSTTPIPTLLQNSSGQGTSLPLESPIGSRSVSPAPALMGSSSLLENRGTSLSGAANAAELAAALQGFTISEEQRHEERLQQEQHLRLQQQQQQRQQRQIAQVQAQTAQSQAAQHVYSQALQQQLYGNLDPSAYRGQMKFSVPTQQAPAISLQPTIPTGPTAPVFAAMYSMTANNPYFQNMQSAMYAPQFGLSGYPMMMPGYPTVAYDNSAAVAALGGRAPTVPGVTGSQNAVDVQQLYKYVGQGGTGLSGSIHDNIYLQYLRAADDARAAAALSDPSHVMRGYMGSLDMLELQKGQLTAILGYNQEQKSQFARGGAMGLPIASKSGAVSPAYYGSPPNVGLVMPYPNSPMASPVLPGSPVSGPGSLSLRRDERSLRHPSGASRTSSANAATYAGWQNQTRSESGDETRGSSLLEEFKNSKTRRFELSDIAGHVVEFSADQHGSRFIQQKLETATPEEKAMVFQEVLPRALVLMTDVFGNYVIQKFFEHGTPQQRRDLASQLVSHVLALSLQMYGCRVIQKALEVVDLDQQTKLVSELDGQVMRCVRDQNGNHVIQKCIECVPPDRIHFIISAFYGQVVVLSTHPYGCRVIQRVLEHCTDDQKQRGIMEEILRATCTLAQDQYGNYVVQHVLEHGRAHERSEIITKLAGQIVQMSQHKFASNVVEKCLEFGGPAERQILIDEMLGHTDENEPLQAMMKDQFANYVVQKVLETCDDQQREMLLSRIRVHLHALKKFTYGKHIVARVEKLVAAGERRSANAASYNLAHLTAS